jgi:hypothetical protein
VAIITIPQEMGLNVALGWLAELSALMLAGLAFIWQSLRFQSLTINT